MSPHKDESVQQSARVMIAIAHEWNLQPQRFAFFVQSKVPPFNLERSPKMCPKRAFESQDVSILIENKPLETKKEAPFLDS